MIAYAQAVDVARSFLDRINEAILFPLITLMLAIALLVFLYGAFEYVVAGANNEQARRDGRTHIMYGIIGMLVMVSAYTILYIAANTFGIDVPANPSGF